MSGVMLCLYFLTYVYFKTQHILWSFLCYANLTLPANPYGILWSTFLFKIAASQMSMLSILLTLFPSNPFTLSRAMQMKWDSELRVDKIHAKILGSIRRRWKEVLSHSELRGTLVRARYTISTSVWSVQHPKAGRNIQHIAIEVPSRPYMSMNLVCAWY